MDRPAQISIPGVPVAPSTMLEVFEPAYYNDAELRFFLEHIGESPVVALHGGVPQGVNPVAVQQVLGSVYTLEELRKARGAQWKGPRAITESITEYLDWRDQCADIHRRGGPKHPSLYAWDSDGRGIKGGTGSDAGVVRTKIVKGKRHRFAVRLTDLPESPGLEPTAYVPDFLERTPAPTELIVNDEHGTLTCPICHFVTQYAPDSAKSRHLARMNMAKHLRRADTEINRHAALRLAVFGSGKTQPVEKLKSPAT